MAWSWFGVEIHSETIYYITLKSDPTYFLYDYDPKSQKRTWTRNPAECLYFDSKREVNEMIERHLSIHEDFDVNWADSKWNT